MGMTDERGIPISVIRISVIRISVIRISVIFNIFYIFSPSLHYLLTLFLINGEK